MAIPESGPEFEQTMREIDAGLMRDGVAISARPIQAVIALGRRFKVSLPLVPAPLGAPAELAMYNELVRNIQGWYDTVYGERTKVDFSVGSMVVAIDGDFYVLRFPRVYGTAQFTVTRKFLAKSGQFSRAPVICNVLQLVQNLTEAKAASLSDGTLAEVMRMFDMGFQAHDMLQASQDQELIRIARGDVQTAVNNLMDPGNRFTESKWASLQAAEKALKAAIALAGAKYEFTHSLAGLCEQLESLGIRFDWRGLVARIQCSPHIRYGSESCSRDDALSAHQASLRLMVALADGGAKFKRLLSRQ